MNQEKIKNKTVHNAVIKAACEINYYILNCHCFSEDDFLQVKMEFLKNIRQCRDDCDNGYITEDIALNVIAKEKRNTIYKILATAASSNQV